MSLESLFQAVQKACLPGVWSRGVALARENRVIEDSRTQDELAFRIQIPNRPLSPKVTLWPEEEDWYCDCRDRNDPCLHVAAAVVSLKNRPQEPVSEKPQPRSSGAASELHYRFTREQGSLSFDRWIVKGDREERLAGSLVSYQGGVGSGRIAAPPVAATREDFGVDAALGGSGRGVLNASIMTKLLPALKDCPRILLDAKPVQVSARKLGLRAEVVDEGEGFRIRKVSESGITEVFRNGAALCGEVLRPVEYPALSHEEAALLAGPGRFFPASEAHLLAAVILPALEKRMPVEVVSSRLPRAVSLAPQIVIALEAQVGEELSVLPKLVYGDPPIAEIHGDQVFPLSRKEVPLRDLSGERLLIRGLQNDLHLQVGQVTRFRGLEAVEFRLRLKDWKVQGAGAQAFDVVGTLDPHLQVRERGLDVIFSSGTRAADPARVFQAWQEGVSVVPLIGGGWARLPADWLGRYGERILELLEARGGGGSRKELPSYLLPTLVELGAETQSDCPKALQELKGMLERFEGIPEAPLPGDLRAELRPYQKAGVNWLCFLRDWRMGAMLADDMGLGKTLQALCAIRGRTLIVMPTSVLQSWADQIQRFRPELKFAIYHGGDRKLLAHVDVILTTYGLLRLDRDILISERWGTVILDEAQLIKNPESQVAQAAHQLEGDFKIALTGTPLENRLDDLWSQFQFLNPGLLGARSSFLERFAQPIQRGASDSLVKLRQRIKPFILRRMKRDVAQELPPRTEVVLHCELTDEERDVYQAILLATKQEVVAKLEQGGSVFGALEALLRLRQASCHLGLLPGRSENAATSSKMELLMQALENSLGLGHRALVFSQWTSLLDLLEPQLGGRGISFLRLDGSTQNRDDVVRRFQDESGPPVMLISLKAGGLGLTLTRADHIFIMDPWWNPAVEDQAADRAHRIGQVNPVLIQRLVAKDTVEDRILELQKKKMQLAGAVLEGASGAVGLTREDLLELLR